MNFFNFGKILQYIELAATIIGNVQQIVTLAHTNQPITVANLTPIVDSTLFALGQVIPAVANVPPTLVANIIATVVSVIDQFYNPAPATK